MLEFRGCWLLSMQVCRSLGEYLIFYVILMKSFSVLLNVQGLAIGQNRRQQTLVRDGLPHSSMSVRVYIGSSDERNRLGEVLIGPDTTIGELRRVVQARYNLPATYKMKKRNVPIHTGQDHHPAYDFFTSEAEDHIVVDP